MNDFEVKGQDASQIHINNQTNTSRMHNCGGSKTHSPPLSVRMVVGETLNQCRNVIDSLKIASSTKASMYLAHFTKLGLVFVLLVCLLV